MTRAERDPTLDPKWLGENLDRMLGYEILQRSFRSEYQEMNPVQLEDAVGVDYGFYARIINKNRSIFNRVFNKKASHLHEK